MSVYIKKFITQKSYEEVVFFLRRDLIVLLKMVIFFIFLLLIPFGVYYFLQFSYPGLFGGAITYPLLVILLSIYLLLVWLIFFTAFIDYYLDFWIVTNDRIVNVQQHVFSRIISELDLYRVQDVTTEVKGVLPTFFNYGNIYIQTAGARERFIFEEIPNPHQVAKKIMELAEKDRRYHLKEMGNSM